MKKLFCILCLLLCFFTSAPLICAQNHEQAEENFFHIEVRAPKKVRVGEAAHIEVILPPFMPEGSTPTVDIETSTSPQEDFSLDQSFPTSTLIFKKTGHYAFSVHIGFSLKDL